MRFKSSFLAFALVLSLSSTAKPILSFFNEMKGPELKVLFSDSTLIPTLKELHAEIRMGMLGLSPERADILKKLNAANIPVVAWLLLPEEQGYWFHSGNGEVAITRYKEIKQWADAEGIRFSGIGLDLELDMNDLKLIKSSLWRLLIKLPGRLYDGEAISKGHETYDKLLGIIKADGYPIESYYASPIKDETKNGTTSLQRLTKFLDVETEKEIPMVYTSFMGNADGFLKVYALDLGLQYVALGSTGGGFDPTMPTLSWDELAHDLRIAALVAEEVHIFSLEGTVQKGFLPKLVDFNYDNPAAIRPEQVEAVKSIQSKVVLFSTILSHPTLLFTTIIVVIGLILLGIYTLVKFLVGRVKA